MKVRSLEPEILDHTRPPIDQLERIYGFLRWVNAWLGGVRGFRQEFERFSARWSGTIRILDVATGIADVPIALVRWARKCGLKIEVTGLDIEEDTLELARRETRDYPEIKLIRGDATSLPFEAGSFDYVISNLFFHHLPDDVAVAVLRSFDRIAKRGIVVNDLLRRRRLYAWTWFFTRFGDEIVRFDGPQSVRKSFTFAEAEHLAKSVPYLKARVGFGHRFILAGEK